MLAHFSHELDDPVAVVRKAREWIEGPRSLGHADFYTDSDGNLVFTAAYHLKRGSCCGLGCRHCPF